jgi:hypothetical protein
MSGAAIALTDSACSFAMISRGVAAGTAMPNHEPVSKPFRPCSSSVGVSPAAAIRFKLVTPSARTRPLFTCGIVDTIAPK